MRPVVISSKPFETVDREPRLTDKVLRRRPVAEAAEPGQVDAVSSALKIWLGWGTPTATP